MDTEQCIADHQNHSKYLAINVESFRASLEKKKKQLLRLLQTAHFFFYLHTLFLIGYLP